MGIGSVTSAGSMLSTQMITAASTDPKIKTIQNEITDARQQMQKLSSTEELSANEKANERKKLQKEISDLNTELRQQQEELRMSQKREIMMAELQKDQEPAKEDAPEDQIQPTEALSNQDDEAGLSTNTTSTTESPETVISRNSDGTVILKEEMNADENRDVDTDAKQDDRKMPDDEMQDDPKMHAMVSAHSSVQQANRQGTIIAKTRDGIAILKGEMNLDELRGQNTEKKQAELEKMEQKEERATAFQFSILGEANMTMRSATETNVSGITNQTQIHAENNAFFNAMKLSQEDNNLWMGRLL